MATGGKTHDADAIDRDAQFLGIRTHVLNCPLRIAELYGVVVSRA